MEKWKDVVGYEGHYEVSDQGNVRNRVTGRVLKFKHDAWGYLRVNLSKDGKQKSFFVHRLVAMAFIPNKNNYPQINHKDEKKENNTASNLEWCTCLYNINYGTKIQRAVQHIDYKAIALKFSIPVDQYDKAGNLIASFLSSKQAERETGIASQNIRNCCLGKTKTAGGYIWKDSV